ncbi:CHAT domain-containing protein [Phaeodactylibacter luteus]|uniref:CHAT domain-containing protein n=1 Tax=Phaeodactylibacter luteus TaxID=1564516 RepID=A0A5C6RHS0_9BACT|nr:CHAT domain-containing tetratricopeptide repeat protein [Phaeodactylibacter luteus]TXB61445.1 CHAT domain-containing protein [Phaeodactylibacter luteus]
MEKGKKVKAIVLGIVLMNTAVCFAQNRAIPDAVIEELSSLLDQEKGRSAVLLIEERVIPYLGEEVRIRTVKDFETWRLVALGYFYKRDLTTTIRYCKAILNQLPTVLDNGGEVDPQKVYSVRNLLGVSYVFTNEVDLGLLQFEQQVEFIKGANFEIEDSYLGKAFSHMGYGYLLKKDYETAAFYLNKAKLYCKVENGISSDGCYGLYNKYLADYYNAIQEYGKAEEVHEELLALISEKGNAGVSKTEVARLFTNAGHSYYYKGDLNKAITFFKHSYELKNTLEESASTTGISLAAALSAAGRFEEARYYLRKGLEDYNFQATQHPFEALSVDDQKVLIGLYFMAKNEQASYDAGLGEEHLYLAAAYREYSVAILERMGEQIVEKSSARYLLDRFYYIFEEAINTRYVLYEQTDSLHHLEAAFQYAARSKTMRIREVQQREALEYTLPKALIERQQGLRSRFVQLENQQYDAGGQNEKLGAAIRKAKEEYYAYIDSLRTAFPQAASLWEAPEPPSLEDVQQGLKARGQGLLQYFIGYQYVFSFIFDGASATLTKAPLPEQLPERVDRFRSSIYQWALDPAAERLEVYTTEANWLYETFIAPLEGQLSQRLIIIPDNVLSYVPFEALLKEKPAAEAPLAAYPYLLKSFQFSYAYSPYMLLPIQRSKRRQKGKVLAYAPLFSPVGEEVEDMAARQRQFGALLANEKEAAAIQGYFPTELRTGEQASAARFLEEASGYQVLHLATHAKANDSKGDFSFLCFSELPGDTSGVQNRIYARDLYDIDLSADLVVLSACETGIGEFSRGEGVISLSNAFAKAGAKSLVTTLWRISDEAAAIIMEAFYANLKDGQPKDLALHNAKLAYWAQSDDQGHHPFFWAAFVPQGDMRPLSLSRPLFPFLLYGILGAIFVLLGVNYMKKRNQAHATH